MERQFFKITRWARAARFWLLLLGALLAWIGCAGEARAQTCSAVGKPVPTYAPTVPVGQVDNQQQAYERCMSGTGTSGEINVGNTLAVGQGCYMPNPAIKTWRRKAQVAACHPTNPNGILTLGPSYSFVDCPADKPWNEETKTCGHPCHDAPPILGAAVRGSLSACHNGCSYDPDPDMLNACLTVGHERGNSITPDYCKSTRWRANGQTCGADNTEPNDPDKPTCISTGGGFSHCVMEDGEQCVFGASGRRYCWKSGETGPRVSGDGTEGAALTPEGAPITPPPNMQNPTQVGDGATVTTGGGGGGTTINNTTNFTGSGNSGGQGNVGEGGSDRPGGGFGTGSGNGDGDEIDWGEPGDTGGDLYTPSEDTVAGVFGTFKDRVTASPLLTAADAFFTAPTSGPGCPTWVIPASEWSEAMVFDFFCNPALALYLTYAGYILLAVAAMYAFHIAIGD